MQNFRGTTKRIIVFLEKAYVHCEVRLPITAISQDFRSLVGNLNMISDRVMQVSLFCMQQRKYSQTLLIWILGAI